MPTMNIALPFARRERPDGKALDTFFSLFEPSFRLPPASTFLERAHLFRSESRKQSFCLALPEEHHRNDAHNPDENHADDDDQCQCAQSKLLPFLCQIRWLSRNRHLPRTPRRDVAATNTQHLIADSECGRRFLCADPSPGHKMHNQEDDADNQQYVE